MAYAIFGDSYVKRLESFTQGNLRLHHGPRCSFYGESGMTTGRKFLHQYERLCGDHPRFVFMILGGNDIRDKATPEEIYRSLMNIVGNLKARGVERVFVSSIVERGRTHSSTNLTVENFNKMRKAINEKLKKTLKEDYVDTGRRLSFPLHYDRDLVHPGFREGGMLKLRHEIVRAFSSTVTQ